jgi:hypothetical protein
MLNTLGLDMGDALSNVAAAAGSFSNMLANSSLFGTNQGGFGAASTSQAGAQPSLFATDFNPAMVGVPPPSSRIMADSLFASSTWQTTVSALVSDST